MNKSCQIVICVLENKSLLCPDSDLKIGDLCAAFHPYQKIDPMGRYCFVSTADGETHSVTKRFLQVITWQKIDYEVPQLCTANEEKKLQVAAMVKALAEYEKEVYNVN